MVETLQGFVIRRVDGGFCLHGVVNGQARFCGADRRWVDSLDGIGNPFPTFAGVEWYLSEWKLR